MTDEPTYTLGQAEQLLRERQCAQTQHLLVPVDGSACRVYCSGCQRTFDLVPVQEAS